MHEGVGSRDGGRRVDWSGAAPDYARFRPGPPERLFEELTGAGCGGPGRRVLDLGTGTGVVARGLTARGARVVGIDVAAGQLAEARRTAPANAVFARASAEALPFGISVFDSASANQCWLYFDARAMRRELGRVLRPGGVLATSHFSWLPREDRIAAASEALVLRHNPDWSAADWHGEVPAVPAWSRDGYRVRAHSAFDVDVPFTQASWRGRIRASRGIGATLDAAGVARFDAAHEALLRRIAEERFTVRHRVDWHVFELV